MIVQFLKTAPRLSASITGVKKLMSSSAFIEFLEKFERKDHKQMMRANVCLSQIICDLNISMQLEKKSKEGKEKGGES